VHVLDLAKITFDFGRETGLVLSPTLQTSDILMVSVIVIIVAVLGSLQPALKASRMEPITALRHV
jgi:putative ABC transport system permease protein